VSRAVAWPAEALVIFLSLPLWSEVRLQNHPADLGRLGIFGPSQAVRNLAEIVKKAAWEGNSTAVYGVCQLKTAIYCIVLQNQ